MKLTSLIRSVALLCCVLAFQTDSPAWSGSSGYTLTTLHSFGALNNNNANADGGNPIATLVLGNDGSFYGTTNNGGASGSGTVFKITPSGALTTLYSFKGGTDGVRHLP